MQPKTYTPTYIVPGSGVTPQYGQQDATGSTAIRDLQAKLNAENANTKGYVPLVLDGKYGNLTKAAYDASFDGKNLAMMKDGIRPPLINAPTLKNPTPDNTGISTGFGDYTGPKTPSSYINDSSQTRNAENALSTDVTNMMNGFTTSPELTKAHEEALKTYTDYANELDRRRAEEEAQINTKFDILRTGTEGAQKSEVGSTSAGLLRLGGYLGESGSGTGVMLTLASKHRAEIASLEGQRQSALQEARNAINDKQFALAQKKAEEAKGYEQEINNRKNTFFNQVINLSQENRAQDTATRSKIEDDLKAFSSSNIADIPQQSLDAIDKYYHTTGFAKSYIEAAQKSAAAKTDKDVTEAQKSYIDLLQTIPTGQVVKMPDGSTITGLGKSSDIEVFNKENANGGVTVVAFNKLTGQLKEYSAGNIGTPSSGGKGAPDIKTMTDISNVFTKLPKDANGFIAPVQDKTPAVIFNSLYTKYQEQHPGGGQWFLDNYLNTLAPKDRSLFTK